MTPPKVPLPIAPQSPRAPAMEPSAVISFRMGTVGGGKGAQVSPAQGFRRPKVCPWARQTWLFQRARPQLAGEQGWGKAGVPTEVRVGQRG